MTILIEMITSTSVRGWEGNEVRYQEFQGSTLREYLVQMLKDEHDLEDNEVEEWLSGEGDDCFGFVGEVTDQDTSVDYEGEEVCITYNVVTFSKEDIEMFRRHMD